MNEQQAHLIEQFLRGKLLSAAEIKLLDTPDLIRQLETVALSGTSKNSQIKQIFKLLNAIQGPRGKKASLDQAPDLTMHSRLRDKNLELNRPLSGGGANGTGKN